MQKILIIEDDKKLRHELEIFLNRNGLNSKCIETFENTIEDIINEKADLILLDINLPNYDHRYTKYKKVQIITKRLYNIKSLKVNYILILFVCNLL